MSSTHTDDDDEEDTPEVPEGVIQGIADISEGRTADGENLDEALDR